MLRTYITTIPLQGKFDLECVRYERRKPKTDPIPTCFPIVQVLADTAEPGDEVRVLAIRQLNGDTARNYALLVKELGRHGVSEQQITTIPMAENQESSTLLELCEALVSALPERTRVYTCITFGTKSIPVVQLTALSCAEKIRRELEIGGIYYGEIRRENGEIRSASLNDVGVLYHMGGLVSQMQTGEDAQAMMRHLLWLERRGEG